MHVCHGDTSLGAAQGVNLEERKRTLSHIASSPNVSPYSSQAPILLGHALRMDCKEPGGVGFALVSFAGSYLIQAGLDCEVAKADHSAC